MRLLKTLPFEFKNPKVSQTLKSLNLVSCRLSEEIITRALTEVGSVYKLMFTLSFNSLVGQLVVLLPIGGPYSG